LRIFHEIVELKDKTADNLHEFALKIQIILVAQAGGGGQCWANREPQRAQRKAKKRASGGEGGEAT